MDTEIETRTYAFSAGQYRLVEDVRNQLGMRAAAQVECLLSQQIRHFYMKTDKVQIIRNLAKARGVALPKIVA